MGALVCSLTGMAFAESADVASQVEAMKAEIAQLRASNAEVQSLRAEVNSMKSQNGETWLNERRAEEVKSLVREVLADADTRASLQGSGMTAGYNKGFFLASEDGKYLLQIGGRVQVRYIANFRDHEDGASTPSNYDDTETGFQIRRMKPFFKGFIGSPKIKYNFVLAADRNATTLGLEEAVVEYQFMDGVSVYGGRTKAPFLHEELTSSGKQLTVERSAVNEIFTTGFVEGVGLRYESDMIRAMVMVNDGQNSGEISQSNAPYFPDSVPNGGGRDFDSDQSDIAVTARAEMRLLGDWKQYDDFAAWSGEETLLVLGTALHYEVGETGNLSTSADNDKFLMWTADAQFEVGGFGLYGAIIGRHDNDEETATEDNHDAFGAVVQASYMVIPDKFEPFVRWEYYDLDNIVDADENQLVTAGFNYYLDKHNAKFTVDAVWAYHDALFANFKGLGLLQDTVVGAGANESDNQIALRAQFQLQF
ncbi:MAG: OprO/OprP family phosphate-selective porin [Planctomycetes bacterium]|nr:OprO/OprP family phosphate-selective porin [Planctomycetota bacterium]